jgi:PAS domain S-box-containing protein
MEQGSPKLNFQERQSRPDGSVWWLQTNKLPLLDRDGKVTGVLGTYEDITERKRVEMEFRLTQFSMEHASDAVEWIDSEGRILYVNQAECRALGRSREEVLSLSIPDIDPLFSKEVWRAFWNDLKARGSMTFETRRRSKPERVFPVEVTATYLEFDGQEYCFALLRDMTERKRADRELRMTKSSLENTSDTLLWIDAQSRILYANDAVCRSLGYSREEILSMSITDIDPHFPREGWAAFWEECKTKGSKTFEAHNKTKQGRVFPVEVTANYLEFDGQEYCFAFARDISERRELESQLRHAQKLEGIGQLSSGIAHEINTPIQFVADNLTFLRDSWKSTHELLERYRGAIQNAAEMTLSAEVRAALKQAEQECDWEFIVAEVPRAIDQGLDGAHRVAKIVRAMKEFSHPDSAEKTATDLNKAIESTITVARNEWKYVAELITNLDVNLPAVVCYPGDINQVILNLVVNGAHAIKEKVKDGEKGRITVCTRMRGEFAEISIADTGTGIPEAIRSRVFDPFFTTKEVGKGTGQGLSLAHAVVVKKHSGKIWFETEVGVGTTFFIDLPIKLADPVGKK